MCPIHYAFFGSAGHELRWQMSELCARERGEQWASVTTRTWQANRIVKRRRCGQQQRRLCAADGSGGGSGSRGGGGRRRCADTAATGGGTRNADDGAAALLQQRVLVQQAAGRGQVQQARPLRRSPDRTVATCGMGWWWWWWLCRCVLCVWIQCECVRATCGW